MFCKNCGNEMDPKAVICVKCGVRTGDGHKFCSNCGNDLPSGGVVCTRCGFIGKASSTQSNQARSRIAAGLLGVLIGSLGVHNFYLGYTGKGVAQLLITLLSCGLLAPASYIWGLIEGILILTNSINEDAQGIPLRD